MQSRPRSRALWSFAPYLAVAVMHVVTLAAQSPLSIPTKALLMPLLALPVALAWKALAPRGAAVLLSAALLLSWLGDEAGLFFPVLPELPLMLAFFALAHIAYILLFLRHLRMRRLPAWTVVFVLWWLFLLILLGPHTGYLLVPVGAYGLVLAGTAATATRCGAMITAGAVFFLASDSTLAFRLFLPDALPIWTSPAVMVTYTIGQGLIVAGALRALHRDGPEPDPARHGTALTASGAQSVAREVLRDHALPDQALSDQAVSDQAVSDQAVSDRAPSDHALSDQSEAT